MLMFSLQLTDEYDLSTPMVRCIKAIRELTREGLKQTKEDFERVLAGEDVLFVADTEWLLEWPTLWTTVIKNLESYGLKVEYAYDSSGEVEEVTLLGWKKCPDGDQQLRLVCVVHQATECPEEEAKQRVHDLTHGQIQQFVFRSCPTLPSLNDLLRVLDDLGVQHTLEYRPVERLELLFLVD